MVAVVAMVTVVTMIRMIAIAVPVDVRGDIPVTVAVAVAVRDAAPIVVAVEAGTASARHERHVRVHAVRAGHGSERHRGSGDRGQTEQPKYCRHWRLSHLSPRRFDLRKLARLVEPSLNAAPPVHTK